MENDDQDQIDSYNGRWVALIRGKIIAQGETKEQAFQAAKHIRSKEIPEIRFLSKTPVTSTLLDQVRAAVSTETELYLVGGAIRDAVLGNVTRDLDFACGQGVKLARKIADKLQAGFFILDNGFDTARVVIQNSDGSREILDFAGYRGETLLEDLQGRDFTMNAVAMNIHTGEMLDPLGGLKDIREKRIRSCSDTTFSDDPVRILRAVRLAPYLGFNIDLKTRKQMREASDQLHKISTERIRDELFKILEGPKPDAAILALELLGVLPAILPELTELKGVQQSAPHVLDVWSHTLAVLRHLSVILDVLGAQYNEQKANSDLMNGLLVLKLGKYRQEINKHIQNRINSDRSIRSLLFFSALFHDVNKPQTKSIEETGRIRFLGHDEKGAESLESRLQELHLSNDEIERAKLIVFHHMRIHGYVSRKLAGHDISRRAIFRFYRDTGESGVDLILLALADSRATYEQSLSPDTWTAVLDICRELLEAWFDRKEDVIDPKPLLTGDDLILLFKQKQGPEIGWILNALKEDQAAGFINNREQAEAFVRGWIMRTRNLNSTQIDKHLN